MRPIFVDLDGTLIRSDVLFESIVHLVKKNFLYIFCMPFWLIKGRAYLKGVISRKIRLDVADLPYEEDVLEYLRGQKKLGRALIMATASHEDVANSVASHLGIFDDVLATTSEKNLKGKNKLIAIEQWCEGKPFSYAGDSTADAPIWEKAEGNIFVNAPSSQVRRAEDTGKKEKDIRTKKSFVKSFIKGMRPHQYAKNLLIFVPVLAAHSYNNPDLVVQSVLAFLSFSLCASGVYFLNDILDINADRKHPTKKNRPLASGDLSIVWGFLGAALLPVTAFIIAIFFLNEKFTVVLLSYYLLTSLYSFWIKKISTVDVMVLALLYTIRLAAGAMATNIFLSSWLLAFSVFVFVSLGYLKRYVELRALCDKGEAANGRGYSAIDAETMFGLGSANITAAVVILALYINSDEVKAFYGAPQLLWALCFLMLYWGNRIWVGARRGKIADDPVVFALKDRISLLVGFGFVVTLFAAKNISY